MNAERMVKIFVSLSLLSFTQASTANSCRSAFLAEAVSETARDARVDKDLMFQLTDQFGALSDKPESLKRAYSAFFNGAMSLSVFKKIANSYPSPNVTVSLQVFKSQLESLRKEYKKRITDHDLIMETFASRNKRASVISEKNDYYLLDFDVKNESDVNFIGLLGSISSISPLIFEKADGLPSDHFFRIPTNELMRMNDLVKQKTGLDVGFKYGFINQLKDKKLTLNAAKKLIEYDGQAPINVVYTVDKKTLLKLKDTAPSVFQSDLHKMIEKGFAEMGGLDGSYLRLNEAADSISYRLTVKSLSELEHLTKVFVLVFDGRISMPE